MLFFFIVISFVFGLFLCFFVLLLFVFFACPFVFERGAEAKLKDSQSRHFELRLFGAFLRQMLVGYKRGISVVGGLPGFEILCVLFFLILPLLAVFSRNENELLLCKISTLPPKRINITQVPQAKKAKKQTNTQQPKNPKQKRYKKQQKDPKEVTCNA